MRGFELGVQVSSEVDSIAKAKIKSEAIEEAIERLNGNHKKNN